MDFSGFKALIENLADGDKNTAKEVRDILFNFLESIFLPGDIKEIDCTAEYIAANFDATGLGINERAGWARCNGLNGTRSRVGKTSIGYGDNYSQIGNTVGANSFKLVKANIPELDSTFPVSDADNGGGTKEFIMATQVEDAGFKIYSRTVNKDSPNTAINVMQSSIITLVIQKL